MSEMILESYNNGTDGWSAASFKTEMHETWESLRPYYNKLHSYGEQRSTSTVDA
jgi:hypothetical protein